MWMHVLNYNTLTWDDVRNTGKLQVRILWDYKWKAFKGLWDIWDKTVRWMRDFYEMTGLD